MTETNMTLTSLSPKLRTEILASVKERVLKEHFNVGGVNYNEWAKRFDERSPTLLDVDIEEFEGGVRKALAELGSSHTVFYHERTIRLLPQHSINATIRAFERDGRESWHFLDVFEDGPAHLAGIKRGEMLVAVDGTPYAPPTVPPFRIGTTHRIAVASARGENPREIAITVPFRKGTHCRTQEPDSCSRVLQNRAPQDSLLPRSHGD
jgi:C-terminal processing protease CtpA/Prc